MDRSREIAAAGAAAGEHLEAKHEAREITFPASRKAVRACAVAIRAVHRHEYDAARQHIAEANLTLAYVSHEPAPDAASLGMDTAAYLNGMAEAASELRRQVLDCLRR